MTATDPQAPLKEFEPRHEFFVGIDSDGCVFDTMEVKHKECFIPNIIKYYNLASVSKYAREAGEFVNLYSTNRGVNRWPALLMVFDLLADRAEVQRRGVKLPEVPSLREWAKTEKALGNPQLKAAVEKTGDPVLKHALSWSEAVNATIAEIVHDVPPFPFVRESFEALTEKAAGMGGTRPRQARRRDRGPGDGEQDSAPQARRGRQVPAGAQPYDRRRAGRHEGRPRQRLPLLPRQPRARRRVLAAVL